jgi:hypothetical protein
MSSMTVNIAPAAARSRKVRSAVTNGSRVLSGIDGRSAMARRYRDLIVQYTNDLGGDARISEAQRQLLRRAAMLSLELEKAETETASGQQLDLTTYTKAVNTLRRVLQTLGIKAATRRTPTSIADLVA